MKRRWHEPGFGDGASDNFSLAAPQSMGKASIVNSLRCINAFEPNLKRAIQVSLLNVTVLSAVMCLGLSAVTVLNAQERMRAGNWENTVIASGQTVTKSACLSAHDAAMSSGSPAVIREEIEKSLAKSRCKLADFKMDDNSKTETMVCGADTIRNETTFHGGDTFDTTSTHTNGGVVTVAHFKGRRTGDCKAGSRE